MALNLVLYTLYLISEVSGGRGLLVKLTYSVLVKSILHIRESPSTPALRGLLVSLRRGCDSKTPLCLTFYI